MTSVSDLNQETRRFSRIRALWRGEVPLGQAFWWYAIVLGSLLNLLTTLLFMALLTVQTPGVLTLIAFVLPIPYNVFVLVAVWRSADSYEGPPDRAKTARVLVILWALAASFS